jgi:hypothetical protein
MDNSLFGQKRAWHFMACTASIIELLLAMSIVFVIEDEGHAEWLPGEYEIFDDALSEVRRLAAQPWDTPPNQAPCISWEGCGRDWTILECNRTTEPVPHWTELNRTPIVEIRKARVRWLYQG